MQLIAEQLRSGRISGEEACRRAADLCQSAGKRNLEYILRHSGQVCDDADADREAAELAEGKLEEIKDILS